MLSLPAALLRAGVVYKYQDVDGNVAYSASPPPVPLRFEIIEIPDAPDTTESDSVNYDRIRDMAEQLEKDRKQREAARAAARQAQEQASETTLETPEPPAQIYFYPVYPSVFTHRHRPASPHSRHRLYRPPSWRVPLRYPTPAVPQK